MDSPIQEFDRQLTNSYRRRGRPLKVNPVDLIQLKPTKGDLSDDFSVDEEGDFH